MEQREEKINVLAVIWLMYTIYFLIDTIFLTVDFFLHGTGWTEFYSSLPSPGSNDSGEFQGENQF
jgi:hypothetical protein